MRIVLVYRWKKKCKYDKMSTITQETDFYKDVLSLGKALTDAVQAVESHSLKGPPHHGILLQHLVEVVY